MTAPHGYNLRSFIVPREKPSNGTKQERRDSCLSHKANNATSNEDPTLELFATPRPSQEDGTLGCLKAVTSSMLVSAWNPKARRKSTRKMPPSTRSREDIAPLQLQHAADIHDSSVYDVELQYPSGRFERFAFGKRRQRKEHRYARPIEPFEDLINTIYYILDHHFGTTGPQASICIALRKAWQDHASWSAQGGIKTFRDTIAAVNTLTGQLGYTKNPLSPAFVENFFDQLHDRVIADNCAELLHRNSTKSTENVYGELRPRFVSQIFKLVELDKDGVYLDLGSRVGQTAMQASLETQCEAHGIERERKVHALAQYQLVQFWARADLYDLSYGDVILRQGDFLTSRYVRDLLPIVDVVLLNNLKLDAETDLKVCEMLEEHLKTGAHVVSTRSLKPLRRGAKVASVEITDGWSVRKMRYEAGSVSWTDTEGDFFISERL